MSKIATKRPRAPECLAFARELPLGVSNHGSRVDVCRIPLPSFAERYRDRFPIGAAVEPVTLDERRARPAALQSIGCRERDEWASSVRNSPEYDFHSRRQKRRFRASPRAWAHGHTLLWHQMQPNWLFRPGDCDVSPSELAERLRSAYFRIIECYANMVDNWDVVNEAVSETPGKLYRNGSEGSAWYQIFGSEVTFIWVSLRERGEASAPPHVAALLQRLQHRAP
ncbi:MAG: endo-1,4-beta-xylanase [Polyangiaceae bacterium]